MLLVFLLAQFVDLQSSGQLKKKPDSEKFPDKLKPNIKKLSSLDYERDSAKCSVLLS